VPEYTKAPALSTGKSTITARSGGASGQG